MKKGNRNNNLKIFNDKYCNILNSINNSKSEMDSFVKMVNDISLSPRELVDFCYNDMKKMPDDSNVLILGGGYGREANRLKLQYGKYNVYTLDYSPWGKILGERVIKNVNFVTGDMCNLYFEDNFFDIVFSLHSLEHTSNIDKTMEEVYRVIKNNGIFGLAYPYKWHTDEQHVYMFEDDIVEYMSIFGEVEDVVSVEHQSRMLKIIIKKECENVE
jgi:ubiquinone/menaquinone biosynthesis C-methylase UbiE